MVSGRPSRGRPQGREEGRRPQGLPAEGGRRPGGDRPVGRPWMAKRPSGGSQGSAAPFLSGPNRTVGPAARVGGDPGRSGSYGRPRPGGGPSSTNRRSEPGGEGARPPFKRSTRPSKSWPRAGSASGRPGGRPGGGKPSGKPGGRPGKPPERFRGAKPGGKKPGA